jgi:hypothetical protein
VGSRSLVSQAHRCGIGRRARGDPACVTDLGRCEADLWFVEHRHHADGHDDDTNNDYDNALLDSRDRPDDRPRAHEDHDDDDHHHDHQRNRHRLHVPDAELRFG